MKKERNIAVVLLLTLILITLVILCLLLITNRLGALGQSEKEKQATMIEELEREDFTTEDSTHSSKETVDDFSNPEDAQNSEPADIQKEVYVTSSFSWKNQFGKNLTLQVDVPDDWIAEKPTDPPTIDQHFDNQNGIKIAGSFGIVDVLTKGETLQSLNNPAGFLTHILESQVVLIDGKEFLLEKVNLSDSHRPEVFVYNYCFEQDGIVINFYFYNDSDDQTQLPLYEAILSSIRVDIS